MQFCERLFLSLDHELLNRRCLLLVNVELDAGDAVGVGGVGLKGTMAILIGAAAAGAGLT